MYTVNMNVNGKMQRVCIESTIDDAYETCAELVRSGKTNHAVAYGVDFENRNDEVEVFASVA